MRRTSTTLILLTLFFLLSSHELFLKSDSYFFEKNSLEEIYLINGTFDKSENVITRDRIINPQSKIETANDSLRIVELNNFWNELSRTVKEGDFEGYKATYHEDAVVIFATGENKVSIPISKALANWKQGFNDTKAGKTQGNVEFRFSQRIGDSTTAHETGIFLYQSYDENGKNISNSFVHFEMLFVKQKGVWLGLMEYQKAKATQEEWELLE